MEDNNPFIDYYGILQVNPQCSLRTLEVAYRHLAKIYHPDHPETANIEKFKAVIEAYRFLKDIDKRSNYDIQYALRTGFSFRLSNDNQSEEATALTDANFHAKMLMHLYRKRRECARNPGVGSYDILRNLNCSEDNLEFHTWYLKKKGFIESTDDGTLAITVVGVDHVIAMSQNTVERQLSITQSDETVAERWREPEISVSSI